MLINAVASYSFATLNLYGQPPERHCARAAAIPALVPSTINSRSNSAIAAKNPNSSLPLAVVSIVAPWPVSMTHYTGEPMQAISAVRMPAAEGPAVRLDDLYRWFGTRGFEMVVQELEFAQFASPTVPSPLGQRAEVEVSIAAEDGEVTSLYCRFLLTRDTPARLERWKALVQTLGHAFGLRIGISDTEAVDPEEFLRVVGRAENWRHFAEQFGWVSPSE